MTFEPGMLSQQLTDQGTDALTIITPGPKSQHHVAKATRPSLLRSRYAEQEAASLGLRWGSKQVDN